MIPRTECDVDDCISSYRLAVEENISPHIFTRMCFVLLLWIVAERWLVSMSDICE